MSKDAEIRDYRKELLHLYTSNAQTFYSLVLACGVILLAEADMLTSHFRVWFLIAPLIVGTLCTGGGILLNGLFWARMSSAVIGNLPDAGDLGNDVLYDLHKHCVQVVNARKDMWAKLYKLLDFDKTSAKAVLMLGLFGFLLALFVCGVIALILSHIIPI